MNHGSIPSDNIFLETDPSKKYLGHLTYRMDAGASRSFDHNGIHITPGTRIVMSCIIKVGGVYKGELENGANIGFDAYDASGVAIGGAFNVEAANSGRLEHDRNQRFIPLGTDWTMVVWDFIVPQTYEGGIGGDMNKYPIGSYGVPATIVPYTSMWNNPQAYCTDTAWFSDFVFMVNPDGYIPPNPNPLGLSLDATIILAGGIAIGFLGYMALLKKATQQRRRYYYEEE